MKLIKEIDKYKFDEQGNVIPYYGNTIISFLNQKEEPMYQASCQVQEQMKKTAFADCLAFLPPSSFHVTIQSLCRVRDKGTPQWPAYIPENIKFGKVDSILKKRVDDIAVPDDIVMIFEECLVNKLVVKPYDKQCQDKLKAYRDQVAEVTEIRHPWHDEFKYHISLNYVVRMLDEKQIDACNSFCRDVTEKLKGEAKPFKLSKAEFVIFNDMFSYETDLGKRGELY